MANLIITNQCNIQCPFCFASESKPDANSANEVTMDTFWEYINKFRIKEVRFCGGEPTTHSQFIEMLDEVLKHDDMSAFVMTNGIWSNNIIDYIRSLPLSPIFPLPALNKALRLKFLFNLLTPQFYTNEQWRRINQALEIVIPDLTTIGYTIYKPAQDYQYLIDLALKYEIPRIRYSIAAPTTSTHESKLINPQRDFKLIASDVYELIMACRKFGVSVSGDCGYVPPCFFTDKQIADMTLCQQWPPAYTAQCTGGSPIDINAQGEIWRCYGLYSLHQTSVDQFSGYSQMERYFARRVRLLENFYLFEKCETCEFRKNKTCYGGCYALRIAEILRSNRKELLYPLDNDQLLINCIPYLSPEFRSTNHRGKQLYYLTNPTNCHHKNYDLNLINLSAEELKLIGHCNGKRKLFDIIDSYQFSEKSSSFPNDVKDIVLRLTRKLFHKDIINLKIIEDVSERECKI